MLNRQRREKPLVDKAIEDGERMVKPRFGVDEDICTGDHACMRLSGCPSLSVKSLDDPLRDDPVAAIDQNCVGCGNCGEVADAAVLCPSFYRADVIHNPNRLGPAAGAAPRQVIGWLQGRRDSQRLDLRRNALSLTHARARPASDPIIKLAVLAVGGQGGGVLTDWIVDLAERNGWLRNRPRCRASPSAPAPRSTTSRWSGGRTARRSSR